jgi:hypothetical protein
MLAGWSLTKESVLEKVRVGRNVPKTRPENPTKTKGNSLLVDE